MKYTFENGEVLTSKLSLDEIIKRSRRLDLLRVMAEGYDIGEIGNNVYKKALQAYDKKENFTGIIRLNRLEKDWLSSRAEDPDLLTDEEKEVVQFYLKEH